MEWIIENRTWIFSGIGVSILSALATWLNYYRNSQETRKGSINAHASRGGRVTIGDNNTDRSVVIDNSDNSVVNIIRRRPSIIPLVLLFAVFGCFTLMSLTLVASGFLPPPSSTAIIEPIGVAPVTLITPIPITDVPTVTDTPIPITDTPTPEGCPIPDGWQLYQVQSGDTLSELAAATNTTWQRLVEANCKESTGITVGETLYVPFIPTITPPTITPAPVTPLPPSPLGLWSGTTEQGLSITFEVVEDFPSAAVVNVNVYFDYGDGCPLEIVEFNSIGSGFIFSPSNDFSILNMETTGARASISGEFDDFTFVSGNLQAGDARSVDERINGDCPSSTTISWTASRQ